MVFQPPRRAEPTEITAATAIQRGAGWTISVTWRHPDTGWDHYADGWEVLDADGQSLGLRALVHPHVDEQPFTRALSGIEIPAESAHVAIRSRDNMDGRGDKLFLLSLEN